MADEYQCEYEYSANNTISFKTNDFKPQIVRPGLNIDTVVDGTRVVHDTGASFLRITCTALVSGNDMDTLHGVQTAAIDYTGAYPRLKKIYWDGDSTESNYEVALMSVDPLDRHGGWWLVALVFEGKDQ
ncbi:MAG: hypothetical protein ACYTBJ_06155 [Planctomycetota bacterium]|jgi:hypothetical protein